MLFRLIFFGLVTVVGFLSPFPAFAVCALMYGLFWKGYELLVLAVFIDALFGASGYVSSCLYTLVAGCIVIGIELIRPHLRFYESS